MGKVVGYLFAEDILCKGKKITYQDEHNGDLKSYYRVSISDINNPYFLRAYLDLKGYMFNSFPKGNTPESMISQCVQDYPLDPIASFFQGKNWREKQPSGLYNLTAKPTLKMSIPAKRIN